MPETSDPSEEGKQPEPAPAVPEESATPFSPTVLSEEKLSDGEKKRKEFWIGFWFCLGLNILFGCVYSFQFVESAFTGAPIPTNLVVFENISVMAFTVFWLTINVLIIIILAATRRRVFEGIVAGFALAFLISLLVGVFWTAACTGSL